MDSLTAVKLDASFARDLLPHILQNMVLIPAFHAGIFSMRNFKLSSDQCELLDALETAGSVREVAKILKRDESVISRQIQQIASIAPVLEKVEKRWKISALGKQIVQWSREAASRQSTILQQQESLRIATTREFSARILCPNIRALIGSENISISVFTSDDGIESELLSGRADIGIDCGRPEDPLIRFKSVIAEPYAVVASPAFLKKHSVKEKENLIALPHLRFNRDPALHLLQLGFEIPNIFASFNDLGSVKSACCAGLGWATIPRYCIQAELNAGTLKSIPGWKIQSRSFGVWWVRGRQSSWVEKTIKWLGNQKL
jgi:LysR family glycine cleavage system transcriptional activator